MLHCPLSSAGNTTGACCEGHQSEEEEEETTRQADRQSAMTDRSSCLPCPGGGLTESLVSQTPVGAVNSLRTAVQTPCLWFRMVAVVMEEVELL